MKTQEKQSPQMPWSEHWAGEMNVELLSEACWTYGTSYKAGVLLLGL